MARMDLWEQIYRELSPDHSNIMKTTKFKDVPWKSRYQLQFGTIDIDIDANIIVYGNSIESLGFAHRVADFYGLKYKDSASPEYKRKLGDGMFDFNCKIYMNGTFDF